jgi:hypothetical protein
VPYFEQIGHWDGNADHGHQRFKKKETAGGGGWEREREQQTRPFVVVKLCGHEYAAHVLPPLKEVSHTKEDIQKETETSYIPSLFNTFAVVKSILHPQ